MAPTSGRFADGLPIDTSATVVTGMLQGRSTLLYMPTSLPGLSVTKAAGNGGGSLAISGAKASPNPTTGPVTVSGSTNRSGAKIEVKNADGTVLCSTTGATTAVGGLYSFSCAGTVSGQRHGHHRALALAAFYHKGATMQRSQALDQG